MDEEGSAIFSVIIIGLTYFSSCRLCLLPSTTKEGRSKKKGRKSNCLGLRNQFLNGCDDRRANQKTFLWTLTATVVRPFSMTTSFLDDIENCMLGLWLSPDVAPDVRPPRDGLPTEKREGNL